MIRSLIHPFIPISSAQFPDSVCIPKSKNDVSAVNSLRKGEAMHKIITLVALASLVWGCQHGTTTVVPQTSRTGNVHNVKVGLNEGSLAEMTVGVGDEILFFNAGPSRFT